MNSQGYRVPAKPTYEELEYKLKKLEHLELERNKSNKRYIGPVSDLSRMIHGMAIPAFIIDNKHFVTEWNKACEKLTGFSASNMIGSQDAWKAFYQNKRPVLADLVVEGSPDNVVGKYYDKYSKLELVDNAFEAQGFFPHMGDRGKWLYFTATPVTDSTGIIIGAVETCQDITKRKSIEEHHRLLLEAIPDPVVVYSPNHRITFINEAFEKTYGWKKSDLLGGKIDFVPPVNGNEKCTKNGKIKMYHPGVHWSSLFPFSSTDPEDPAVANALFENVWPRSR
jgi:PAS domain S-box-containing protein